MSDRLSELQRQRALIQGHLAWLDAEIAAVTGKPAMPAITRQPLAKPEQPAPVRATAVEPLTDELIAQFGSETKSTVQDTRKGCILLFVLGMVLLGIGAYGLILYSRSLHANDAPPAAKSAHDLPEKR